MEKMLIKAEGKWIHFCYITSETREQMNKIRGNLSFGSLIAKWALDDFNITIKTLDDVTYLKETIFESYKEKYPFLFISNFKVIDSMGITRIWVQENVYKEMRNGVRV